MQIPSSVKGQTRPWFMDESLIPQKLATVPEDIRLYVEQIIEDGFTVIPRSVSQQLCDDAIAGFKRLENVNREAFFEFVDKDGHYPRIINLHAAIPEVFALFTKNPLAYRVQETLFDARPCLYSSLFYERGSAQDIHRDTPVFSTKPEHFYFGVWVALEDSDPGNGALQVCRGGHKLPELDREQIALKRFNTLDAIPPTSNDLWVDYQNQVQKQCAEAGIKPESIYVKAGDTIIWHPQLPHGGGPIADLTRTRFSLVMHTTPVGVPVYHQDKFFNPTAPAPLDASWWYEEVDGHIRMKVDDINFGHTKSFKLSSLNVPAPLASTHADSNGNKAGFLRRLVGR